ncbi:DUF1834 family protein [Limnobaculum zhutongyuii]|uniref:DUF1834 family protein n=1 Tax=Limnobaculum zhutongyuii TaxID=2498113 RepID=A0A411WII1_9GAMM|nr:DUF1834 family protein [Limnobaculum zhutongyuii]QBH95992.1 DUF1834 family protein [Limnobaculum zhutongyuii]TQS89297.1 DUF1834 family protein [Limnobaculum zhutongyuii]
MITDIETALVARLQAGLGKMVREVASYAGELDDDVGRIVSVFPAIWVTFGGITKTEPSGTSHQKYKTHGRFVVVVGDYNPRSEASTRQGGVNKNEVGSNLLVQSVRRLLIGQDLGLAVKEFMPGRVKTLFNTATRDRGYSVYACEFDTYWMENALENGKWPLRTDDPNDQDAPFNTYHGRLSDPDPDLTSIGTRYHQPGTDTSADVLGNIKLGEQDDNATG